MRKKRRTLETFNLSFLDVVCCGFGAVILLVVITKLYEPVTLQVSVEQMQSLIVKLRNELDLIRGESLVLNQTLKEEKQQLSESEEIKNKLNGDLSELEGKFKGSDSFADQKTGELGNLKLAKQKLDEEMVDLLKDYEPEDKNTAGGISVDSKRLVFILDDSGSMFLSRTLVIDKMEEILEDYPTIEKMVLMNNNGDVLTPTQGWIMDDQNGRGRQEIMNTIRDLLFNTGYSIPEIGIEKALQRFYDGKTKMGFWILGDDYTITSASYTNRRGLDIEISNIESLRQKIWKMTQSRDREVKLLRINAIYFPCLGEYGSNRTVFNGFIHAFSVITQENGGSLIAVTDKRNCGRAQIRMPGRIRIP